MKAARRIVYFCCNFLLSHLHYILRIMSAKEDLKKLIVLVGLDGILESNPLLNDEEVLLLICLIDSSRYLSKRSHNLKTLHWWEEISYFQNPKEFRNQFRMNADSFFKLSSLIKDLPAFNSTQDPVSLQLAVALSRLGTFGTGCGVQQVAIKFSISVGSVYNFTDRVINALTSLSKDWIQWPSKTEREFIGDKMASKLFPKCIGFVDGTDAVICDAPLETKEVYWSRKKKYSMQVQIICDPNKLVRDLYVGFPGSVHDAKVYATSPVGFSPSKYFSEGEYIIGDSAYPLSDTVIVPYRNTASGLERKKKNFNFHLCSQRVAVEHTIGVLKGRFQSLKGLRIRVNQKEGHAKVCSWVHACVILHNMLMLHDPWVEKDVDSVNENYIEDMTPAEDQHSRGNQKREALFEIFKTFTK